jgi:hypothetical protein
MAFQATSYANAVTGAHPFVKSCALCRAVGLEVPVKEYHRPLLCVALAVEQHQDRSPQKVREQPRHA